MDVGQASYDPRKERLWHDRTYSLSIHFPRRRFTSTFREAGQGGHRLEPSSNTRQSTYRNRLEHNNAWHSAANACVGGIGIGSATFCVFAFAAPAGRTLAAAICSNSAR